MKKTILSLLYLFMALSLHSCHNEDDEDLPLVAPIPPVEGTLSDGESISDIMFCCIEVPSPIWTNGWYEYYTRTKTLNNYHGFKFNIIFNKDYSYTYSDSVDRRTKYIIYTENSKQKTQFITDSYKKNRPVAWPFRSSAYLNGEAKITCDKVLFGEPAGSNIGSHFFVNPQNTYCLPVGIEEPKLLYDYGDTIPNTWNERFCNEVWIETDGYILNLAEEPSEKYDEITLHLSLPLTIEHLWDWAVAKYNGEDPSPIYSDTTFYAECKMKFKWE